MLTMTLQDLGHEPGRARRLVGGVPAVREQAVPAARGEFHACGTTGVVAVPANAYLLNDTTTPAGAMWFTTSIKRTARHLGARTT